MHQHVLTARTVVVYAMIRQFLDVPTIRVVVTDDIRSPDFVFHPVCSVHAFFHLIFFVRIADTWGFCKKLYRNVDM